jgi:hypothetical protein
MNKIYNILNGLYEMGMSEDYYRICFDKIKKEYVLFKIMQKDPTNTVCYMCILNLKNNTLWKRYTWDWKKYKDKNTYDPLSTYSLDKDYNIIYSTTNEKSILLYDFNKKYSKILNQ